MLFSELLAPELSERRRILHNLHNWKATRASTAPIIEANRIQTSTLSRSNFLSEDAGEGRNEGQGGAAAAWSAWTKTSLAFGPSSSSSMMLFLQKKEMRFRSRFFHFFLFLLLYSGQKNALK